MHLVVVGESHKTAPLELRERLSLPCDEAARLARELADHEPVADAPGRVTPDEGRTM
jgi:glutamyl-tRNA reductase